MSGGAADSTAEDAKARALAELAKLRVEIERVDSVILDLLAERVRLGEAIGEAKRQAGLPVLDPSREAAVIRATAEGARARGLPADAVREIWWRVVALARSVQTAEGAKGDT